MPVGKRIAFDSRRGRLWVICPHCVRWNLVPFDTRLETIDRCEELFATTPRRFSTDNIGIARHPEGVDLIRIGPALGQEYAAWRYGDTFGKRRRKHLWLAGAGIAILGGYIGGGLAFGLPVTGVSYLFQFGPMMLRQRVSLRFPREGAAPIFLSDDAISRVKVQGSKEGGLQLHCSARSSSSLNPFAGRSWGREHLLEGQEAIQLLVRVMARMNRSGGTSRQISDAVSLLEGERDPVRLIVPRTRTGLTFPSPLSELDTQRLLAIEMAVNTTEEERALTGELHLLEWQWKEAERLAKIADDLVLDAPDPPHSE